MNEPERFIVTELEGWAITDLGATGSRRIGTSFHVIDTHWNNRLVATYRTDGTVRGQNRPSWTSVRSSAYALASSLNEKYGLKAAA